MGNSLNKINYLLMPFSWLYGSGVWLRNKLFDLKILKSRSFPLPVISIGNLAVGGTGKTPHTEYLINLLKNDCKVCVLSRGYKRKTKGFVLASDESDASLIGDEPMQIKSKFSDITVAVDEDRCHGIEKLLSLSSPDVILLDDAFQHRYVKPGISILLTEYNHLFTEDFLMPAGRLREQKSGMERADIIIVTKCPDEMQPIDYRIKQNQIKAYPYQKIFFTKFCYDNLVNICDKSIIKNTDSIKGDDNVILVTGIANPKPITDRISKKTHHIKEIRFNDHHDFNEDDIKSIIKNFKDCCSENKYIITTEKDAARMLMHKQELSDILEHIYVLPVKVRFLQGQEYLFNQIIKDYVRKNSRNSGISEE